MSNLSASFASIVKNNAGIFKSESQANFHLAHCTNMIYRTEGNSSYSPRSYICDEKGITKVIVHSKRKYVSFEREIAIKKKNDFKIAQEKRQKLQDKIDKEVINIVHNLYMKFESMNLAEDAPSFDEIEMMAIANKGNYSKKLEKYNKLVNLLYKI